jgi:cell division protein FtsI/penicillin-binding protein 2
MDSFRLANLCCIAILASATFRQAAAPCDDALARGTVCEVANERAVELMRARNLEAITVVQDVKTGSLVAFAASAPEKLNVTTAVLPLSTVKLMVAATWWDHEEAAKLKLENSQQLLTDSIVSGNDNAGRRIALALREAIGAEAVLKDFERYGFPASASSRTAKKDETFWAELAPKWRKRLTPTMAYHSLGAETTTKDWEDILSLGEAKFIVTTLHLSRFLQAIGNGGLMLPAIARAGPGSTIPATAKRVMSEMAALKLQAAMRETVERGTAKSAAPILTGTGWKMGGKTGTGPALEPRGANYDGWFVGLIFDPQGQARFTVATFVKNGGLGGGHAARISAELARFLSGAAAEMSQ